MNSWHSDEELDNLDTALLALPEENDGLLLSEFDGFCTGLIVCPEMIPPSEWLSYVWGENGTPAFETMEQMQGVLDLVMGHYNRIAQMLMPPADFAPVIDTITATDEVLWDFWISGFMLAMSLRSDAWDVIMRSEDDNAMVSMMGLMTLAKFSSERTKHSKEEQAEFDKDAIALITECVLEINRFSKGQPPGELFSEVPWGADKPANSPFAPHKSSKVGRNELCPCGSAKKCKKCCGAG